MSSQILRALVPHLEQPLMAAGFALADAVGLDGAASEDGFVEYHAGAGDALRILGIYRAAERRTITAELWQPTHVAAYADGSRAPLSRTWSLDEGAGSDEALAREIAEQVRAWIVQRA